MLKQAMVALVAFCAPLCGAQAADPYIWNQAEADKALAVTQASPYMTSDATAAFARTESVAWYRQPDLLGFSVGYYDVLKNTPRKTAADFRVEHRWGVSLLPKIWSGFDGWEPYFQMRPMAGVEATSDGALYGYGGFVFDVFIGKHFFLSPNEVVGAYYRGNGKRLGSFIEFRSTMEVGYRFDNNMRISASFGHISNAGLTRLNSGTEILSGNVYIPVNWVFGD
ncbi:MAG: acyloxyacyl hydrolase [Alphaproteobacteria bacterium]